MSALSEKPLANTALSVEDSAFESWVEAECARRDVSEQALAHARLVQSILTPLALPLDLVRAGAVYPLLDDSVSQTSLQKAFGKTTTAALTELKKLHQLKLNTTNRSDSEQAEALRKMLLAVVRDVRLVMVRIADQAAQLQLARDADRDTQIKLARETRVLFAPLANKLGIWQLKWQLEDLSFRFLEPDEFANIAGHLKERREEREDYISEVTTAITQALKDENINAEVMGRPKHIYSIYKKMQSKHYSFEKLMDIRAFRIMVDSLQECYGVLGAIHARWNYLPDEFDDYIANPKQNGYQSLHTVIIGPQNKVVEVQIRTKKMHEHAELGVAAHWAYKEGSSPKDAEFHERINWLRGLLAGDTEATEADLIDNFESDLFEGRVFALTPAGDVIDLPAGATALDFAYQVHTDLGHRCRGAKIDGRMIPLTHALSTGDTVEVIAAKTGEPSHDWLVPQFGYLKSSRARSKVRAWFRRQGNEYNLDQGRALIERELKRLKLNAKPTDDTARDCGLNNLSELFIAVGSGEESISHVMECLRRDSAPKIKAQPVKKTKTHTGTSKDVHIDGVGHLDVVLAKCCDPSPPDVIQGYVSVGRGVTVHNAECQDLKRMLEETPERLIDVRWQAASSQSLSISLRLQAKARVNLLPDITQTVSSLGAGLSGMNTEKLDNDVIDVRLGVEVSGFDALSQLMHKLQLLPGVIELSRVK